MEKSKRKVNIDVYIGAGLILFSAYLLYATSSIKPESAKFPMIVIMLLMFLSIVVLVAGIRKTRNPKYVLKSDTLLNLEVVQTPLMVFLLIAGYIILIKFIGFFISTFVFVPALMLYYGMRNIKVIIITDIVLNLFVYLLFTKLLNVMLP